MEALLALFGLAILFGIVVVPWIAIVQASAARREAGAVRGELGRLAAEVARLRARPDVRPDEPAAAGAAPPVPVAEPLATAPPPPVPQPTAEPLEETAEIAVIAGETEPPPPPQSSPSPRAPASGVGSLEERLGARLPVWLGGIALALAGIFLVQYSIERGWLSPPVRVALGLLFGLAMLAGGELARRRSERIGQALSAAGIADLYACFLAASSLYHLIPRPAAFALMALNTAVAVALSLRQGPIVAALGLAGGFLTPALIRSDSPSIPGLVAYLLLLQVGLLVVTRRRGWTPLAALALAGGIGWTLAVAVVGATSRDAAALGLFLLASGAAAAWAGLRPLVREGETEEGGFGTAGVWLTGGAALAGLLSFAAVTGSAGYGTLEWALLGLLAVGCLLLARLAPELEPLAWLAPVALTLTLAGWASRLAGDDASRFVATGAVLAALLFAQGWISQWGARRPAFWAWLAALAPLALGALTYAAGRRHLATAPWGAASLAAGVLALASAVPIARRRAALAQGDQQLAALAVAVTAFATAALPLELDRQWLTVALALEVPALLAVALRLRVAILARLATGLAVAVAARLLLNPFVLDYSPDRLGSTPVFNWLLYGYGVPLAAFVVGARLARRGDELRLAEGLGWGAIAFTLALSTLEVRHFFGGGLLRGPSADRLLEAGTIALVWAALGLGLLLAGERWPERPLQWGGVGALSAGLLLALAGPGLALNPAWNPYEVGATPFANRLLLLFGGPLAGAVAGLARLRRRGDASPVLSRAWSAAALLLVFLLVTLEVRQLFRGTRLDLGGASGAENLAYSGAWIALGLALLVGGVAAGRRALRQAGLGVMLVAVLKVFLVDLSELSGLYRVLSFLGLGASLLALAALYQRVVSRGEDRG